jgi:hypothetical protein
MPKAGWMGVNDHRGWRGVSDHLHILLAVQYEPDHGWLCCRFNTGEPLIHEGVPESMYIAIVQSKFGGAYYRKHVRNKFPCPYATIPPPYKPESDAPQQKLKKMAAKRLKETPHVNSIQADLFGQIPGFPAQQQ